jgi:hypothetical protein
MVNHPNRNRHLRFRVCLGGSPTIAAFVEWEGAVFYARHISKVPKRTAEIFDKTGLLAQFDNGKATPEFAHVDREWGHIR